MKIQWVKNMVEEMFVEMLPLPLKDRPPNDIDHPAFQDQVEAWTKCFIASREAYAETVDRPRFMEAFARLMGSPDLLVWPLPARILRLLPPRPRRQAIEDKPQLTAEQVRKNMERVREINRMLAGELAAPEVHALPNEAQRRAGNERGKI